MFALATSLDIPVLTLSALREQADDDVVRAIDLFHGSESRAFSAATVFCGSRRLIVYNDAHTDGRIASTVGHELGHGVLLHSPTPAFGRFGAREWNAEVEEEATYLSGALLIPSAAAWRHGRRLSIDELADRYGCSTSMARWRVNATGAGRRRSA
jgi:Zn-dependent peptidase ImmA (M78 family)